MDSVYDWRDRQEGRRHIKQLEDERDKLRAELAECQRNAAELAKLKEQRDTQARALNEKIECPCCHILIR